MSNNIINSLFKFIKSDFINYMTFWKKNKKLLGFYIKVFLQK